MNTEYQKAVELLIGMNRLLNTWPVWDYDSPELKARDNLAYWIAQYRMGQATYIGWLFAVQAALDVLIGNEPSEVA